MAHLNIQSLFYKKDQVANIMFSSEICIMGLTETFLKPKYMSQEIEITGYTSIRKDRIDKKGGGVLVYIQKDINFIRKSELESDNVESIWLQLFLYNKKSIFMGLVYRPPDAKRQWIKHFEQQI